MRSPGSDAVTSPAWRVAAEWLLRVTSLALVAVLLWRALHPSAAAEHGESGRSSGLARTLAAWTTAPPRTATLTLDSVPAPAQRDWIAALRHAGTALTWSGALRANAVTVTPLPDPAGAWQIDAAAPNGATLTARDGLGPIDTLHVRGGGARIVVPRVNGGIALAGGGASATAPPRDSLVLRRVLVEGSAGWETKFTVAALEERGWAVDALMHVAPNVDVRVGAPSRPDTARYAAAIAIDTSARLISGAAGGFVRSGGGLVTLRDAATIAPSGGAAVVLERRADGDVRAYRAGAGRVIRVSYPDVWRERMAPADSGRDPVAAHRAWLAQVVSSVAYAPRVARTSSWPDDPAPYADLVARAGPPGAARTATAATVAASGLLSGISDAVLAMLLFGALLLEWLSRRLRGAR